MNIFYFSDNAWMCASQHADKHVVKMILEYAQLLSTAHHILDPDTDHSKIYKRTHINHPCAVWVRQSSKHYRYVFDLLKACLFEYERRYGKIHKTKSLINYLSGVPNNLKDNGWVDPPQCMPDKYKQDDTILAYQSYFNGEKQHIAKWKLDDVPYWYIQQEVAAV